MDIWKKKLIKVDINPSLDKKKKKKIKKFNINPTLNKKKKKKMEYYLYLVEQLIKFYCIVITTIVL